jgi:hypothetical protein
LGAVDELEAIAVDLADFANKAEGETASPQMEALTKAAWEVGLAWSGSSLGYQANVYTDDLRPPGRDRYFSVEWGLVHARSTNPTRGYSLHDPETVRQEVLRRAGKPDLDAARKFISRAVARLDSARATVESIVSVNDAGRPDKFVSAKLEDLRCIKIRTEGEVLQVIVSTAEMFSRDKEAVSNGRHAGAHHMLLALALAFEGATDCIAIASELVRGLAERCGSKLEQ